MIDEAVLYSSKAETLMMKLIMLAMKIISEA